MIQRMPLFLALVAFVLFAAFDAPDAVTVTGTLVDTKCYGMNHANMGKDHGPATDCAKACARSGIPVGLLEGGQKDAQVYVLITPAPQLADYMGQEAEVTGELAYDGGIIPSQVRVKKADGAWETLKIGSMM